MQQKAGGPLERVKPFTPEVRAEIDNDLTDRSIAFIRQQNAAGKPFFVYLPFSMGHFPNFAVQAIRREIAHWAIRRQDDGGRLPRWAGARRTEGTQDR